MIVITDDAARAACISWEKSLLGNTIGPDDVHPTALGAMRGALEAGLALLEDTGQPVQVAQHPTRVEELDFLPGYWRPDPPLAEELRQIRVAIGELSVRTDQGNSDQGALIRQTLAVLGPAMAGTPDDTMAGMIDGAKVEQRKSAARLERMLLDLVGLLTGDHKGSLRRRLDDLEDANEAAGTVELAGFEPDPAYNWDSALTMAAAQRDRRNWEPARLRREARWFYAELLAGPDSRTCPECHGDVEDHAEDCGRNRPPGATEPHPYQGESGRVCDICGLGPYAMQPGERIAFRDTTPPDPDDLPVGC